MDMRINYTVTCLQGDVDVDTWLAKRVSDVMDVLAPNLTGGWLCLSREALTLYDMDGTLRIRIAPAPTPHKDAVLETTAVLTPGAVTGAQRFYAMFFNGEPVHLYCQPR